MKSWTENYLVGVFLMLCVGNISTMHSQIQNKICDTIPYEFIREKIIIPVTIHGVKTKYIIDTGGQTGTSYDKAIEMMATAAGYASISDLNNKKEHYQEAHVTDVSIGKNYRIDQLKTMVLPKIPLFEELGVAGILGGDAFANSVLTFDSQHKIIVINYPYRPERLKANEGLPMHTENGHFSNIDIQIGDATLTVLFDTGAQGFFMLCADDLKKHAQTLHTTIANHGFGIVGAGITGLGEPVEQHKVTLPSLTIQNKTFTQVGSITTIMNGNILGADLLKYGKVIIDYMRERFYFLPFSTMPEKLDGAPTTWNINILPRNERFEITSVWDSMKGIVEIGDEVININGISTKGLELSQLVVEEIMNNIKTAKAYIIIRRNGKEKKIEIEKEK